MTNKLSILKKVERLYELFHEGKIPVLENHEVNPGLEKSDRINYIYFTLPVSINFQRSSPAMWQSALKTFNDPETNYLFYPEKVVLESREKVMQDLMKHKLGLQKNKHTDIWMTLSKTLVDIYEANPKKILEVCDFDVVKIITLLQVTSKKNFPFLSGIKISNYWLYILTKFTDATFQNMHEISVIPDTHVIQATKALGMSQELAEPKIVEKLWYDLLKDSHLTPVQMHPVLWHWSRNNFKPEVNT